MTDTSKYIIKATADDNKRRKERKREEKRGKEMKIMSRGIW